MYNPFVVDDVEAVREGELIERSLSGDREALADLVKRHQAWIYNVALPLFNKDGIRLII